MSGRGLPLAVHFRRTELPTGRAITRFLIFDGWVKRGRTVSGERVKRGIETVIRKRCCTGKHVVLLLTARRIWGLNVELLWIKSDTENVN